MSANLTKESPLNHFMMAEFSRGDGVSRPKKFSVPLRKGGQFKSVSDWDIDFLFGGEPLAQGAILVMNESFKLSVVTEKQDVVGETDLIDLSQIANGNKISTSFSI